MTRNEDARQGVQNNADRVHTIGLCMIVKNEAQVITRCLDSVKGLVDYVLIEDTGSTDGTQKVIADWLKRENMLGEVIEEPWQSFAYNRSHVMAKLREVEGVDYTLIIDADDRIVLEDEFRADAWKAAMDVDLYDVRISHGGARFFRPQICSNRKGFYFKAVLHEYLEGPPEGFTRKNAEGFYIQTGSGGARNKNPRKYQDDAAALEKALQTETDPFLVSRYTFYLAQSYRDCGEKELALKNYLKRAEAGYWIEEVFESLYGAAKMKEALDHPEEDVIAAYLKAADTLPTRAEALHGAAKFCRAKGRNEEGYQYAKRGIAIARPGTGLFVESWVYDYGLLDELAVNAYWAGHAQDSLDASLKLLSGNMLPEDQRPRILANARFAFDKLPKEPNLGEAGKASLLDHHAMAPARPLRGRVVGSPRVLIAILAKQKEEMLPLYLECIEALDYPKSQIVLYIRTNNNTDQTEPILREWVERVRPLYADIEFDARDVAEQVQQFGAHEWNATRFKVLGEIRNLSMRRALEKNCDYYFVADVDNFIRPGTLRELVALDLPIVSPLLRSIERGRYYSNYHADVDKNGYFISSDQYMWILNQWIRGVVEVPVVHTTYLVRADVISDLNYVDTTARHEYVIFSDTARKAQIPQYLDNRQVYGYIAFGKGSEQYVEGGIDRARELLQVAFEGDEKAGKLAATTRPLVFSCFGLHRSGSTWMFNLARDVCKTKSIPFASIHRDWSINLPWQTPGVRVIVAKSHSPMADFKAFVANSPDPAVITVRDPRDSVVSFMQTFSDSVAKPFGEALAAIALSAERLVAIKRLRDVPVFRYEDGFVGAQSTVARVAELLGVTLSEQERDEVLANLEPDAVRAKIGELEKSGVIKTEADWDRETQWHKGHVGDGKVGKWHDVITAEQEREILNCTREFCERFGYGPESNVISSTGQNLATAQAREVNRGLNSLNQIGDTSTRERTMSFTTSWQIKHRQMFFGPLVKPGSLVFDIGANIGEYTATFLSCGARRVVALEPQSEIAAAIAAAFPVAIKEGVVVVRAQAVGSLPGVAEMFPAKDASRTMSTLSTTFRDISRSNGQAWDDSEAFKVEVVTLDSLIDEFGTPDYIKIDVEGFDFEVLRGLTKPVDLVSFEFNTQDGLIEIAEQCISYLSGLARYEFNYQAEAPGQTSLQLSDWVSAEVMRYTVRHDVARSKVFGDIFARRRLP